MKKVLLILVIIVAFVAIVFAIVFKIKKQKIVSGDQFLQNTQQQKNNQDQDQNDAREEFIKEAKESNEIIGVVDTIYDPKGKEVRFLKIDADIVNINELGNVDFSRRSPELPMTKEIFKIAVDDSTKLLKVGNKNDINSGDMVRVKSGNSIYKLKEFTALEIEVVATR